MKNVRYFRLPLQMLIIFLQIVFFLETVRLHMYGYIVLLGIVYTDWNAMLSTLVLVAYTEFISFGEALLFFQSQRNAHSILNLVAVFVNAVLFCTMAYYTEIGTIMCLAFYGALLVLRVVNLICNICDIRKLRKH